MMQDRRTKSKWLRALLCAAMMLSWTEEALAAIPPVLSAEAAILVEAGTGRVLYEKNADRLMYPASMTKIMTCILALEDGKGKPESVRVSERAADVESTELRPGDVLSSDELLLAMMMESDNGAASALAEAMAPSIEEFAARMTEKAARIGAHETRFANANGMPSARHVSTARDMMKIARYAWTNPEFRRIVGMRTHLMAWQSPRGKTMTLETTNALLGTYAGMAGIKTGWTRAAGGCFAGAAERNGVTLISIVMNAPDTDERFTDTQKLMDYGFPLVRMVKGPVKEKLERTVWVHDGKTFKITAHPRTDVRYMLFAGDDEKKCSVAFDMPRFITAPIAGGDKVGDLVILYDGKEVGRIDMIADHGIQKGFSPIAFVLGILSPFLG